MSGRNKHMKRCAEGKVVNLAPICVSSLHVWHAGVGSREKGAYLSFLTALQLSYLR